MTVDYSQLLLYGTELSASMTGSTVLIGTLASPAVILIFDNQSTVPVAIYVNGSASPWKTFTAGEAIVLDLRTNTGFNAKGTTFSGNGASGTFSISYIYANQY